MPGRLVERFGGRARAAHALEPALLTIGRAADNDIVVAGDFVSQRHAEVQWDGAQHILRDTSKNGTFVNGVRITAPQPLRHGDVIVLPGLPGLAFVFESNQQTATWKPEEGGGAAIQINTATAEVWARGRQVHLRPKEYRGLVLLAEKRGGLVS